MTLDENKLLEYVLGNLTSQEEAVVVEHLKTHPENAAWVSEMFAVTAELALSLPPETVAADAADTLLARIRVEQPGDKPKIVKPPTFKAKTSEPILSKSEILRPKLWPRAAAVVGLAAALLLAATGFREPLTNYRITQWLERSCSNGAISCQTLTTQTGAPLGTLALGNNELLLVLDDEPPAGQVYQAWKIVGDMPASLGIWEGRVFEAGELEPESIFGVTLEPSGGSPQPTSAPIIAVPVPAG